MRTVLFLLIFNFVLQRCASSQNWQSFAGDSTLYSGYFYDDSLHDKLYALSTLINDLGDTVFSPSVWNNANFKQIGGTDFSLLGPPQSIICYQDTIYIGGAFNINQGANADFLMKYQNGLWEPLNYSPDNLVWCFKEYNGKLIIGGAYSALLPIISHSIIQYSAAGWETYPYSIYPGGHVKSICLYHDTLVFSGVFGATTPPSYDGNVIGMVNDSLVPFGNGFYLTTSGSIDEGIVTSVVYKDKLYFGGEFSSNFNSNIVCWDGHQWSSVGGGSNSSVRSLVVYHDILYAAGHFTSIGGIHASHIAKWDGDKWCSLGSSFDGPINHMIVYHDSLIVSGGFSHIDGIPFNHIAKWIGESFVDSCQSLSILEEVAANSIDLFPSYCHSKITIKNRNGNISEVSILDISGRIVCNKKMDQCKVELDVDSLSSGVYFTLIILKDSVVIKRFIKD